MERAYLMTIIVTVIGTAGELDIYQYVRVCTEQRRSSGSEATNVLCILDRLFNGGIETRYYMYSSVFQIKNTIWTLIVPNLLTNTFAVILTWNYFVNSISPSITKAVRIDGAGEFRIFAGIVLQLSVPILATIGLMSAIAYRNDWTNGLYFLTKRAGGRLYMI